MRHALRLVLATGCLSIPLAAATPAIGAAALLEHIKVLAADEMRGRANGSDELDRAAEYVAAQFDAAGLEPGGSGGWFQGFEMLAGLTVGPANRLTVRAADGRSANLVLGSSYYPLAATPNESASSPSQQLDSVPLVFAGYGISSEALKYDDYAGLDVTGKAVLIFSHEPQEGRRNSRLNGVRPVAESSLYAKAFAARQRGARALLVVGDPSHRTDRADYTLFKAEADAEDHGIPVLRVRRTEMEPLLRAWNLDQAAADIDQDLEPRSRLLDGVTVDYTEQFARRRRAVRNVVGVLRGREPARAGEAIVIGAHYDHVGVGGRFSMTPERTGEIHNGADDNASGTASIIEMARAAAADPSRFPRSLVFVAFAGEERGLLGSAHYASNAVIPMDRTVAMLNLDMVGRANGKLEVSGLDRSALLDRLLNESAAGRGLEIRRGGPGAGRSDDSNFIDRRVPAVHFFTGFHGDYHAPGDDWQKIDAAGTARVAMLALEFAARIAAARERPAFAD